MDMVLGISSFRLRKFPWESICRTSHGRLLSTSDIAPLCIGLRTDTILGSRLRVLNRFVQSPSLQHRTRWQRRRERMGTRLGGAWRDSAYKSLTLNSTSDASVQLSREQSNVDNQNEYFDVVILSNGPGEVAAWVKPVVSSLRTHFRGTRMSPRVSVVLAPCPHASGAEFELVSSFEEVDRCQGPEYFWKFLLVGSTEKEWHWHKQGVCIFLGGDQLYAILLGLRLRYKTMLYAEDAVRWPGLANIYMLRSAELMGEVPIWAHSSCKVVGDLFLEAVSSSQTSPECTNSVSFSQVHQLVPSQLQYPLEGDHVPIVGLLPGSKVSKLALGVPYFMAVACHLHEHMKGQVRFVLPLAPTATLDMLASCANAQSNPFISQLKWGSGCITFRSGISIDQDSPEVKNLQGTQKRPIAHLVTVSGVQIEVWQQFPAYDIFRLCTLCLTTIGTSTAELGLLGIPMLVVLPTHALQMFKGATGGLLGLLANAPGWLGNSIAQAVNLAVLKSTGYIAWPNRWAREEVVPELVGRIEPTEVSAIAAHYLKCGEKLRKMKQQLLGIYQLPMRFSSSDRVSGGAGCGAGAAIAAEVERLLSS